MIRLFILLVANIALTILVILQIQKSLLNKNTKTILYIVTVVSPIIGLIAFLIINRKNNDQ